MKMTNGFFSCPNSVSHPRSSHLRGTFFKINVLVKKRYYRYEGLSLAWDLIELSWVAPFITTDKCFSENIAKFLRHLFWSLSANGCLWKLNCICPKYANHPRVWLTFLGKIFQINCLNSSFWKCSIFKHSSDKVASL